MFKRGGGVSSRNNGIVQGFEEERQPFAPENTNRVAGGSVLEDFRTAGLLTDVQKPQGLTPSDYLRIAAAGAQIMGAQPTGRSGVIGALQAASPALSGLGVDLAESSSQKNLTYQNQLQAQKDLMASGIVADRDANLQRELASLDKDEYQRALDDLANIRTNLSDIRNSNLSEEEKQNQISSLEDDYIFILSKFSAQDIGETGQLLIESGVEDFMKAQHPNLVKGSKEYEKLASEKRRKLAREAALPTYNLREFNNKGGRVGMDDGGKVEMAMSDPSPEAERGDTLDNLARKYFKKPLNKLSDDEVIELEELMDEMPLKLSNGGPTRAGDNEEKAAEDRMKMESDKFYIDEDGNLKRLPTKRPRQNTRAGMNEEIAADAARRRELNKQYGRAEGGAMTEAPQAPKNSPLTFEELRARLPMEVTDTVVRLLASSEAALLDFANIDTEQDIAVFNQKYNSDLQLPTQVA